MTPWNYLKAGLAMRDQANQHLLSFKWFVFDRIA
jgi:hypothetical protein